MPKPVPKGSSPRKGKERSESQILVPLKSAIVNILLLIVIPGSLLIRKVKVAKV